MDGHPHRHRCGHDPRPGRVDHANPFRVHRTEYVTHRNLAADATQRDQPEPDADPTKTATTSPAASRAPRRRTDQPPSLPLPGAQHRALSRLRESLDAEDVV